MKHVSAIVLLFAALALSLCMPLVAQQSEDFGDFEVHYSTLNTNMLSPDVARAYGIQRSGNRAMLNVTVLDKSDSGLNSAMTASVSAEATNLTGQRRVIDLQEIRDQDAIYYVGTFRIHNEEMLNFQLSVQPEGIPRPRQISFRQQFFVN